MDENSAYLKITIAQLGRNKTTKDQDAKKIQKQQNEINLSDWTKVYDERLTIVSINR